MIAEDWHRNDTNYRKHLRSHCGPPVGEGVDGGQVINSFSSGPSHGGFSESHEPKLCYFLNFRMHN